MTADVITLPTPERLRKDKIEVAREQIQDKKGNIGRPFHVLDMLSLMEGVGSISKSMHAAGVRFMDDFSKAQLVTLKAADMGRLPGGGQTNLAHSVASARDRVWDALLTLGGMTSPAGCLAWHVLGEQQNLNRWALERGWVGRPIDPRAANGILIGALGTLLAHYDKIDGPTRSGIA